MQDWDPLKTQIKEIAGQFHITHELLRLELDDNINMMKEQLGPKRLVLNTKNNVLHKILTSFEEAGPYCRAACGWKYAFPTSRLVSSSESVGFERCGTCY